GFVLNRDTARVQLLAKTGNMIHGDDTLITIHFIALVGIDTSCISLHNMRLVPTNNDALWGNTIDSLGSICLYGRYGIDKVSENTPSAISICVYPNPARSYVRFSMEGLDREQIR